MRQMLTYITSLFHFSLYYEYNVHETRVRCMGRSSFSLDLKLTLAQTSGLPFYPPSSTATTAAAADRYAL